MSEVILGFYLVMVSISPQGEVIGEAIDYFHEPLECIYAGNIAEENSEFGIGYVCLEDVIKE